MKLLTPILSASFTLCGLTVSAAEFNEVRFSGALTSRATGSEQLLRQFEVLLLNGNNVRFFHVLDDPEEGCPWPESYGQYDLSSSLQPRLMYTYDNSQYNLPLPPLQLTLPKDVETGREWTTGTWTYTIAQKSDQGWTIEARERRGRRQTLNVSDGGTLLSARQDVFMGQGQRFEMSVTQSSTQAVAADVSEQTEQLLSKLLTLQSELQRRPDTQQYQLSDRQLEKAILRSSELGALAEGTPLEDAVFRIERDLGRQQKRSETAMKRRKKLLNKAAPGFVLNLIDGKSSLKSQDLKGKTVVLHFWKYADKPLSEPYGQVGYLEFLYGKRKFNDVEIIGVAMNKSYSQASTLKSGQRSSRKLVEFMNLSYPIGYDDGSLLRELGDPRESGGTLPLWVVISPAGQIVHYHAGFYEIDQRRGLKVLDDVIIEQVKSSAKQN